MNKQISACGHQYGFYDPESKQFYIIPVKSEEEFNAFLECFKDLTNISVTTEEVKDSFGEKFDDFDFLVEEITKAPESPLSQDLIEFDV